MNKLKHTFFCEDIESGFLSEEESAHALRVLRLQSGDRFRLVNGKGFEGIAEVTQTEKKRLFYEIIDRTEEAIQNKERIHIAIAPTKNIDRFSFFMEKVAELGIDQITPLICKNSERKNLNVEKLRKKLLAALKQSGNLFLPRLDDPQTFSDFIKTAETTENAFIAHCEDESQKVALKEVLKKDKNVLILIGPEGDFRPEEINLAKEKGFKGVSLSESVLRTETAGIIACHTVQLILY